MRSSTSDLVEPPSHPLRYLTKHTGWVTGGVVSLVVTNGMAKSIPWVVKLAVDRIGELRVGDSPTPVVVLAIAVAALAVGQGVSRVLSRILIFNAGREAEYELRRDIFAHLCVLDTTFYRRYRTGDIMSRLTNDLAAVRALYGAGILHASNTFFAYAIAVPLMLSISGWLTFWALLPYPLMLLGARTFARGIYQRSRDQQRSLATMTAQVQEDLAGIREVKGYRLEANRSDLFGKASGAYLHQAVRLAAWRAGMVPLVGAGAGASFVIVLWLGGSMVISGQLTLGSLAAFNLYVGMLAFPTMAIGWILSMWQRGISAWQRLREILVAKPELVASESTRAPTSACVELRNLSVFTERVDVLRNISFTIPAGSLCGLVGRVGSGKTAIAETIARLSNVEPGQLFFDGRDATELSLFGTRQQIAYAPQDAFLFSATVRENIAFGLPTSPPLTPEQRDRRIDDAVLAAGLRPDLQALPQGLDTLVGERGVSLSGGQRQRVALARALAAGRPLLILDDSLSAVDAETERTILSQLRNVFTNTTALLVSHRLSALQHADQIVVLDGGAVAQLGTHQELMRDQAGLYAQLYRQQLLKEETATVQTKSSVPPESL